MYKDKTLENYIIGELGRPHLTIIVSMSSYNIIVNIKLSAVVFKDQVGTKDGLISDIIVLNVDIIAYNIQDNALQLIREFSAKI